MSGYPLPKDPVQAAYLDYLRKKNIEKSKYCQYCKNETVGINSDGYRIIFVCKEHINDIS
jgi:hypothetical protein